MKKRPTVEDAPHYKTRRVILIQDKRAEVGPPPSDPA